jgi:hypothetical protein
VAQRPDVAGVYVYGSLSRGVLTPFSDVDLIAVVQEEVPEYTIEHRVVDGVKVDVISVQLPDLVKLADELPTSLWDEHRVSGYALESLILGPPETILHDPTGEIARVKRTLQAALTYQQLILPDLSNWFHQMKRELERASVGSPGEVFKKTQNILEWTSQGLMYLTLNFAVHKDRKAAAEKLGIPELTSLHEQARALYSPPADAMDRFLTALESYWRYSLEHAYWPLLDALKSKGLTDPEKLELIGDYMLFWPGYRLNELGRIIAEVDLSLRWSRYHLDRGDPCDAKRILWACDTADATFQRWKNLDRALEGAGYDSAGWIPALLDDPEFLRRGEEVDRLRMELIPAEASEEAMRHALAGTLEMAALLERSLPLMPALDARRYGVTHARNSYRLADALADLEALHEEQGDRDGFLQYCAEIQREHPLSASGNSSGDPGRVALQHWYAGEPHPLEDPTGCPVPWTEESSWQRHLPTEKEELALTPEGLDFTLHSFCRLADRGSTAPTFLRAVRGDFTIQVSLEGAGGLMVSKEGGSLRLKRPPFPPHEIRFEATLPDREEDSSFVVGRGRTPASPVYLRLQRAGDRWSAWYSDEGQRWIDLGEIAAGLTDPVQAGVFAERWHTSEEPVTVHFRSVELRVGPLAEAAATKEEP